VPLELSAGVVDVWTVDLGAEAGDSPALSPAEGARAERFRDPQDGTRWRRGRTALRCVLANYYLDADPRELVVGTASHGKPFLAEPGSSLRFNVSHSGNVGLLAFSRGVEVGIDIEVRSRRFDALALARQAFGEPYACTLAELPPDRREEAFLRRWVRHEATLKCLGAGLAAPAPDAKDVWLTDLDVSREAVAALAARRGPLSIRRREYAAAAQSL
jgi:4'-phosphopantetheinyl transferase